MRRTIFVCNALEDETRLERGIYSDSPAASKKVFDMAYALRAVGEQVFIISMGRGSTNNSGNFHKAKIVRINGVHILYAPFSHTPFVSQLLSLISMPYILFLLNSYSGKNVAIFYNRTTAYITSLLTCAVLGIDRILDLEDGEDIFPGHWSAHQIFLRIKRLIYNNFCNGGTILACSALGRDLKPYPELCYYGAVANFCSVNSWCQKASYRILLGGTISRNTGADTLIGAILLMRANPTEWSDKLEFIITGKGDCLEELEAISKIQIGPLVRVVGRLTDENYTTMVQSCDIGLALKPNSGWLSQTTFPSKIIELASAGLLILTTDISDVRLVMGSGAVYLNKDDPSTLIDRLCWIIGNPEAARQIVAEGISSVKSHCSMEMAGRKLSNYIFRGQLKND